MPKKKATTSKRMLYTLLSYHQRFTEKVYATTKYSVKVKMFVFSHFVFFFFRSLHHKVVGCLHWIFAILMMCTFPTEYLQILCARHYTEHSKYLFQSRSDFLSASEKLYTVVLWSGKFWFIQHAIETEHFLPLDWFCVQQFAIFKWWIKTSISWKRALPAKS